MDTQNLALAWTVLKLLGELTIITGIFAGLWKYFTDRKLKSLEGRIGQQIARLSSKLDGQKESAVHVFKSKFDLEVRVYQEIWSCLWKMRDDTLQMSPKLDSHPFLETEDEKKKRLRERYKRHVDFTNESIKTIMKYHPFYPKDIQNKIWELVRACKKEGVFFESSIEFNERYDYKNRDEREQEIESAYSEASDLIRMRIESLSVIEDESPAR